MVRYAAVDDEHRLLCRHFALGKADSVLITEEFPIRGLMRRTVLHEARPGGGGRGLGSNLLRVLGGQR